MPVDLLHQKLGMKLCKALPAFDALTGCDTTSAIASVGKKKAWKVLLHREAHQESLGMVGLSPTHNDAGRVKRQKLICALYSALKKTSSTADELRYLMFCQKRHKSELLPLPLTAFVNMQEELPSKLIYGEWH